MTKCFVLGDSMHAVPTAKILNSSELETRPFVMPHRMSGFYEVCKKEIDLEVIAVFCGDFPDKGIDLLKALRGVLGSKVRIHALFDSRSSPNKALYNGLANEISWAFPMRPVDAASLVRRGITAIRKNSVMAEEALEDAIEDATHPTQRTQVRRVAAVAKVNVIKKNDEESLAIPETLSQITNAFRSVSLDLDEKEKNPPLSEKPEKFSITGKHNQLMFLDPRRIMPLPDQPRHRDNVGFSPESLREFGEAIRFAGQLQPVQVCRSPDPNFDAMLVDGERRFLACKLVKIKVRAEINEKCDPKNVALLHALSVANNFNRVEHTCVESAIAIRRLITDGLNVEQVAKLVGKTTAWVYQHLAILKLHPKVQSFLVTPAPKESRRGSLLSFTIALSLTEKAFTEAEQLQLAEHIIKEQMSDVEARSYIEKFRRSKGLPSTKPKTGSKKIFAGLVKLADNAQHRFGRFLEMSHDEVEKIMTVASQESRKDLASKMKNVGHGLYRLADLVLGVKKTAPGDD